MNPFKGGSHMKDKMEAIKSNRSNQKRQIDTNATIYGNLIEKANTGIIFVQDNTIIYSNAHLNNMLGYGKKELTGVPFSTLLAPKDKSQKVKSFGHKSSLEHSPQYEILLKNKNGEGIPVEISNSTGDDEWDGIDMLIVREISQQRRREVGLRKNSKIESISVFSKGITHDYNDLLTVISGYIHLAQLSLQPEEEAYPLLGKAYDAAKRATDIIRKIHSISECNIDFKRKVSTIDFLRQTSTLAISNSDVECDYIISDDINSIEVDERRMAQAINEIIQNALESMSDSGKIQVGAENLSRTDRKSNFNDKFLHIYIKDEGKGISKKNLRKIFDPYYSTKDVCNQKGLGLGLSLCYSIIKSHKGHIRVESKEDVGTTFHLYLPIYEEKDSTNVTSMEKQMLYKNETRSVDHVKDICDIFMSK